MPQFLNPQQPITTQLVGMSAVLVGLALAWYVVLTVLVGRLRSVIERFRSWIDRITGAVLIALGIRLAVER